MTASDVPQPDTGALQAAIDAAWHAAATTGWRSGMTTRNGDVTYAVDRYAAAAMVRAAAPHIAAPIEAERDEYREQLRSVLVSGEWRDQLHVKAVDDLRARLATAERDALLRAADEIAEYLGEAGPAAWLRDRAAAVGTEETT